MSYSEKRTLVTVATSLLLLATYWSSTLSQYDPSTNATNLEFWARAILFFLTVSIITQIVIQIAFHIFLSVSIAIENRTDGDKEIEKRVKLEIREDERDKLIELKSLKVGYLITGLGFVGGLVSAILGYPVAIMLNIIFLSSWIGGTIEGFVQFYYYRKDAQ
jgi:hypothetical protein